VNRFRALGDRSAIGKGATRLPMIADDGCYLLVQTEIVEFGTAE